MMKNGRIIELKHVIHQHTQASATTTSECQNTKTRIHPSCTIHAKTPTTTMITANTQQYNQGQVLPPPARQHDYYSNPEYHAP
jgi:hypothetical protein